MRTAGWFPRITFVIGVTVLLFAIMLTADAHTEKELDVWVGEWTEQANYGLNTLLLNEFTEMKVLHPWYWAETPQVEAHEHPQTARRTWSGKAGVEQWRGLVTAYFGADRAPTAMCLMSYESGGNPSAKNSRSSAAGLFQFLKGTWNSVPNSVTGGTYSSGQVFDPEANIRAAAWLQANAGWSQWSPFKRGLCR